MRILIVEDDALIGDGIASGLRSLGFAVDWIDDGAAADRALATVAYDTVVLDLGLPGGDGMHWLAQWRARSIATPILILTACDALDSRVDGLDAGADDYLVKPVALDELAARLRAVTRRAQSSGSSRRRRYKRSRKIDIYWARAGRDQARSLIRARPAIASPSRPSAERACSRTHWRTFNLSCR